MGMRGRCACPGEVSPLKSSAATSHEVTHHYLADLAASRGMKIAIFAANLKDAAAELIPLPPVTPAK